MLKIITTVHDMKGVEIINPTTKQRDIIRTVIACQFTDNINYKLTREAGAFLQCDYEDYLLIEFWRDDYKPLVEYLNKKLKGEVK